MTFGGRFGLWVLCTNIGCTVAWDWVTLKAKYTEKYTAEGKSNAGADRKTHKLCKIVDDFSVGRADYVHFTINIMLSLSPKNLPTLHNFEALAVRVKEKCTPNYYLFDLREGEGS